MCIRDSLGIAATRSDEVATHAPVLVLQEPAARPTHDPSGTERRSVGESAQGADEAGSDEI